MARHNILGIKGEYIAYQYLKRKQWKIIQQNYVYQKAEIDIIAQKENILVFVEVKTRSKTYFGFPEQSVSIKKQHRIAFAAQAYIDQYTPCYDMLRFDVISIIHTSPNDIKIHHIEDAFYPIED